MLIGMHSSWIWQLIFPTKEQLFAIIGKVDNDINIFEDPIESIDVTNHDSETQTIFLKDCLIRHQLPLANCHEKAGICWCSYYEWTC